MTNYDDKIDLITWRDSRVILLIDGRLMTMFFLTYYKIIAKVAKCHHNHYCPFDFFVGMKGLRQS